MQCFICVTYMIILCTAHPPKNRETSSTHEKRSLFHDVIESLRIRAQLPEDVNQNEENNLSQSYDRYGFDNDALQLPSDAEFIPRRNDRIEMPSIKYRFPKSLDGNDTKKDDSDTPKEEFVLYISTTTEPPAPTQKPNKQKRPKPVQNKLRNKVKVKEEVIDETDNNDTEMPDWPMNTMPGHVQIGNRESQTVVKPTIILNFRGTISHKDSDIKLEGRGNNDTRAEPSRNVFNIKQEIKLVTPITSMDNRDCIKKNPNNVKQEVKVVAGKFKAKNNEVVSDIEEVDATEREPRKLDSVLEIVFTK